MLFRCSKMSGKRKANFVLGFSWDHENDRYKRIKKPAPLFCLILYHGAGRLARLVSVKLTSGNHLFRNERTKLKLILVAFCSESGSLFLNLDRAFFGFTEKITRGSIQRNCLFPLSVSDPPNFFDFQSWGDLFLRPLFG